MLADRLSAENVELQETGTGLRSHENGLRRGFSLDSNDEFLKARVAVTLQGHEQGSHKVGRMLSI
ncbi:hypothetical protein ABIE78_003809 [Sinorhizobium fredii]